MTGPSQRPRDSQVAEAGAKPCLWFLGWGLLLWSFISSSPSPRELQSPLHTASWSVSKILTGSSPSPQPSGYGLRQGSGLRCCPLAGLISFPHPPLLLQLSTEVLVQVRQEPLPVCLPLPESPLPPPHLPTSYLLSSSKPLSQVSSLAGWLIALCWPVLTPVSAPFYNPVSCSF